MIELTDRFWRKVEKTDDGCWLWRGTTSAGYGRVTINKRCYITHRVSYEFLVGPIPKGLHLDHLCRVRACCNPAHLEPVTCAENVRRSPIHNHAKTHCPQGHPYDEVNTYRYGGRRACEICRFWATVAHKRKMRAGRAA